MKKTFKKIAFILCVITLLSVFSALPVTTANTPEWATNIPELPDYDYSFAVLGDTQNLMKYNNYDNYVAMYDWIIANKDTQKIKYVMGLGDITEDCTKKELEYAQAAKTKLCNNGILNSFIRGNHDKIESLYKTYFPYSQFGSTVTETYKNDMLNTYTKFTAGNVKYIVFALTVGPDDNILNWVSNIASQNPDHNVIITTHVYLTDKATHTKAPSANHKVYYGVNGGEQIWDKLVKKHENIVMVLSGHYTLRRISKTQIKGINGNIVTEMMIDAEQPDEDFKDIGGLGLVAMFYFSDNGKRLDVRYYSTVHDKYYMDINQFTYTLNVVGVEDTDDTPPETTVTTEETTTTAPITPEESTTADTTANTSTTITPPTEDTSVTTTTTPTTTITTTPNTPVDKTTIYETDIPSKNNTDPKNDNTANLPTSSLTVILLLSAICVCLAVIVFVVLKKHKK